MSDKTEETIKEFTINFTKRTTCHGLDQVTEPNRPLFIRVLWFVVVLILFCGCCWQLSLRVLEYMEYVSDTELHEEFFEEAEFPAISICNYNRFFNITDHEELHAVQGLVRLTSSKTKTENDAVWERAIRNYYNNKSHIPLMSDVLHKHEWPLNEDTIGACTIFQKPCSYKDFKTFVTSMGRCFTFTTKDKIVQNVPGSRHGLVLTLNLLQDLYSEHHVYGRPEAGVKVHVHEHDEPAMAEEFGIGIPTGTTGHLVIEKIEKNLLPKPWGICNPNTKKMKYTHKYTFGECMTECRTHYIIERCGCKPYWAPVGVPDEECDVWAILDCAGQAEADSQSLTPFNCSCDQPCKSVTYNHKVSYSSFPSVQIGEILAHEKYENDDSESEVDPDSEESIHKEFNISEVDPFRLKLNHYRDNHVMIDAYFDTLSVLRVSQSKKISEMSLASDFGGLLGLWLGISIVTLGEFIQFCIQLCCRSCSRQVRKHSTNVLKFGHKNHVSNC